MDSRVRDGAGAGTRLGAALALAVLALAVLAPVGLAASRDGIAQGTSRVVITTEVKGVITPVIANHLEDVVELAHDRGAEALIVLLDTPGGLVTSMREIVQSFLAARVPVVVYVSPRGADAGSAGTFITMAAHVAAMAPATTIGAATPVDLEGGEVGDKIVENAAAYAEAIAIERGRNVEFAVDAVRDGRSITVTEAVEIGAVDLEADDLEDLLAALDGRDVELADGQTVTLATGDARLEAEELSGARRILQRLADPNLAFIFLSIATLAIIYEIASPGLGAGGIVGIVLIVLAMFSLSVLPVNYAGAALLILAGVLFVLEMFMPGVGVAAAGGSIALVLGGLFLFQRPTGIGIDLVVILPTAAVLMVGAVLAGRFARRTLGRPPIDNADALMGRTGPITRREGGELRIQLDGTWWSATGPDEIADGDEVVVTGRDGLTLHVTTVDTDSLASDRGGTPIPSDGTE